MGSENDDQMDFRFAKWLSKNRKLQGIPPSAFFSQEHKYIGENYIRFCFIKVSWSAFHASSGDFFSKTRLFIPETRESFESQRHSDDVEKRSWTLDKYGNNKLKNNFLVGCLFLKASKYILNML